MTPIFCRSAALSACLATLALAIALPLAAAPGAHGPGGEHLDAPASPVGGTLLPRLEANSDLFELVAELKDGQLRIYVDRYVSNEPVADASVEVESGNLKALATYQPAAGHYLLEAPDLLKVLGAPGEHPLVFTLLAGDDADLINGTLDTRSANAGYGNDHGHSHALEWAAWGVGGLLASGLAFVALRRRQQRMKAGGLQ
ncbi:MAG: hypothetical protein ACYCWC_04940 [Rhodocyclaceae bacterium]